MSVHIYGAERKYFDRGRIHIFTSVSKICKFAICGSVLFILIAVMVDFFSDPQTDKSGWSKSAVMVDQTHSRKCNNNVFAYALRHVN